MENYFTKSVLNVVKCNSFFQNIIEDFYPMARKPNCDCGYDSDLAEVKNTPEEEKCPVTLALSNHITFPSVKLLPTNDESREFYCDKDGLAKKNWYNFMFFKYVYL